jgi:transcription factor IIIB subunit 2
MFEFINSLASSINASSLSARAAVLFNQAMATGRYRWGRKSKLVAGACIALALRECNRPDALHDVAYLLGETFSTLVRTMSSVIAALGLPFTASDPRVYIPCIQTHLSSLLQDGPRQSASDLTLPSSLMAQLKPLSLHSAVATATSLATLLARFGPDHPINELPAPPTTCALFLLALEAESRAPLDRLGDLAAYLGSRCTIGGGIVMARYRLVQDEVLSLVDQVPWLDKYQSKNGRAKLGKRVVVAKGLKDVLNFQEEIWRGQLKPTVVLDISDGENDDYLSDTQSENTTSSAPPGSQVDSDGHPDTHTKKRRKTTHKPLHEAAQFLLNPLSARIPTFDPVPSSVPLETAEPQCTPLALPSLRPSPLPPENTLPTTYPHSPGPSSHTLTPIQSPLLPLTSYLLTTPTFSLTSRHPPSRLQLLVASRRGEEDITDDELFGKGELERMFRSEQEIESLREKFDWGDWEEADDAEEKKMRSRKKRKRKDVAAIPEEVAGGEIERKKVSKRVNMEALARFLEDSTEEKADQFDYDTAFLGLEQFDDDKEDEDTWQDRPFHDYQDGESAVPDFGLVEEPPRIPTDASRTNAQDGGEVLLNEWRPLSPEAGFHYGGHGRYDEEYD